MIITMWKQVTDHNGTKYNSIAEMCRAWKINYSTYMRRKKLGWSRKSALTTPPGRYATRKQTINPNVTDHLGNKYCSFRDMARHYKQTYATVKQRLNNGWTLERALTEPTAGNKRKLTPLEEYLMKSRGIQPGH